MATNFAGLVGQTAAATWLPTVFGPATNAYYMEQLSIALAAQNYSSLAVPGSKAISIPLLALATAADKTTEVPLAYTAGTVQTAPTITMSTHKALPYLFEDITLLQSSPDLFQIYVAMAGDVLAMAVDSLIATTIKGETTNTVITPSPDDTITTAQLQAAQRVLNLQRIKIANCVIGMSAVAFELSTISWGASYTTNSTYDPKQPGFWYSGAEGKMLGMQVFVSPDWSSGGTAETATIWHPTSIGYATSGIQTVGPVEDPLNVGVGVTLHEFMGATVLKPAAVQAFVNS